MSVDNSSEFVLESPTRLLLDVNVLLSGVVGKSGSIARELYEQALRGEIRMIFNPSYLSELERVLTYERVINLGISSSVVFRMAEDLFLMGEYVPHLERFDWPSLSDPKGGQAR